MTRIGMIGTGAIARVHLDGWSSLPVEIVGHYDIDRDAARRASEAYGGAVYDDLDALLADVDLVDICTPTAAHKECVLAAAAAGTPMICEKPLARHLDDAEEMVAACEEAGVPLYVAHVVRFFPEFAKAKEAIDDGEIGHPAMIRTVRAGSFPGAGREFHSAFYADFEKSGGVILDVGIHDIDYVRWCCGEVERVFAHGLSFANIPERDHALISLRFSDGSIGHIDCSWANPPGLWRTRLEIAGDGGLIEWDGADPAPVAVALRDEETPTHHEARYSPLAAEDNPYRAELAHFLHCLETGATPRVTPHDALMAVKVSLAAVESVRTGQPIEIATFEEVRA